MLDQAQESGQERGRALHATGADLQAALRAAEAALQAALRGRERDQGIIDRQCAHLEALRRRVGEWEPRIMTMRAHVARLKLNMATVRGDR